MKNPQNPEFYRERSGESATDDRALAAEPILGRWRRPAHFLVLMGKQYSLLYNFLLIRNNKKNINY